MNRFACALALVLTVAACSSSHHVPVATSSTTSRGTPASLPPARPDTSLSFSGDSGLDGGLSKAEITCSFPDVEGLRISIFAQASDSRFSYRIAVGAERVLVHVDSGSGPTFRERNFEGTGVSGFDAARGAHVDAKLTEAAPSAGIDRSSIGTITAVKGSIDCGSQTPGSSTITVTGDTPAGRYDRSRLDPVVVECYFASEQVTVIGIAHAGKTKVLLMVLLSRPDGVNVEEAPQSAAQRYYSSVPGTATLTSNGAHGRGDAVERNSTHPHTLHVDGSAVCGIPIRS